jgi:hypothetical protein
MSPNNNTNSNNSNTLRAPGLLTSTADLQWLLTEVIAREAREEREWVEEERWRKVEEEQWRKVEEEWRQKEEERKQVEEAEKKRVEVERKKVEEEKKRVEDEKRRVEAEKKRAEEERQAEAEKQMVALVAARRGKAPVAPATTATPAASPSGLIWKRNQDELCTECTRKGMDCEWTRGGKATSCDGCIQGKVKCQAIGEEEGAPTKKKRATKTTLGHAAAVLGAEQTSGWMVELMEEVLGELKRIRRELVGMRRMWERDGAVRDHFGDGALRKPEAQDESGEMEETEEMEK